MLIYEKYMQYMDRAMKGPLRSSEFVPKTILLSSYITDTDAIAVSLSKRERHK